MEIDRSASATAAGETQIDADSQTVFSVIAAIDDWPAWNPDVKSAKLEGPLEIGAGLPLEIGAGHDRLNAASGQPADGDRLDGQDDGHQSHARLPLRA